MLRTVLACVAFASIAACPALAQAPGVPAYCSSDTAFGQPFGARRVEREGRSVNAAGNRRVFVPRSTFQPFSEFEAAFTPSTRRLHSVQGTMVLTSREHARTAFEQIVGALAADPRFQDNEIAAPDVGPTGAVWRTAKFYAGNAQSAAEQPTGLRVTLYFTERISSESTIAMECVNAEIYRAAEREALAD
ncbi:MAG: hypothetical protein ACREH4_09480 [Vitreimonas sp.]